MVPREPLTLALSLGCSMPRIDQAVRRLAFGGAIMTEHDVLIRNGRVLDGTRAPWFRADVAIRGDRIAAMGT